MPVLASLLFNGNLWIWHAPPLLEAMMHSTPLHVLALLLFLFTGLLFWWPVLAPELPGLPTHSLLEKLLYIFFSDMPILLLGAGLTFTAPLYPSYRMEPRLWGMSAEIDQQLGGLLMWIPGSIFLIVIASGLFLRWMLAQEDELRQRER
jgi:cytochrome c oxidase assembly factor CtaG